MTAATQDRKERTSRNPVRKKVTANEALQRYDEVFDGIRRFTTLIRENREALQQAVADYSVAKANYEDAKRRVTELKECTEGASMGLLRFLVPSKGDVLPLFDRMEAADEEVHGTNAGEWRSEPVGAMRLSLAAQSALADADILLVGQLQDRMLSGGEQWWTGIDGLGHGQACAIADALADFINERSM